MKPSTSTGHCACIASPTAADGGGGDDEDDGDAAADVNSDVTRCAVVLPSCSLVAVAPAHLAALALHSCLSRPRLFLVVMLLVLVGRLYVSRRIALFLCRILCSALALL